MRTAAARAAAVAVALLVVLACSVHLAQAASANPGPAFPFYDNCRRNASFSRWSLRMLQPAINVDNTTQRVCFIVRVNNSASCRPEVFRQSGRQVTSRCCTTSFAKIKFYVDARCRKQFVASPLTVAGNRTLNKVVSPSWDSRPANYTEVKYTQFGPVPQTILNGTTFCLTLLRTGPCNVSTLAGITSPFNRPRRLFQAALYDRKVDGYECCPTFSFRV